MAQIPEENTLTLTRTNSMTGRENSQSRGNSQGRGDSQSRTNSLSRTQPKRWDSSSRPNDSFTSNLDPIYVTKKESFRENKRRQSHLNMTKKETENAEHKKEAYAEMRALIEELADFEAQIRALKSKHVEESVNLNNKCMTEAEINEKEKKKDLIDSKVQKFEEIISGLDKRAEELRIASEIPKDVIKALSNLDRRELLEITKLQAPPALMKQALNFIMTFLDFYGVKEDEFDASSSSSSSDKKLNSPTTRMNSLNINEEDFDTRFDRERTWTEIRKFMGMDMRNQMLPLTTDIILQDEDMLQKFRYKMHSTMDAEQVAKNTGKPTAALFNFIAHLFDCSFAIIERRELVKNIEKFKIEFRKPTLTSNDLFTEMRTLISKLHSYEENMKELNGKIEEETTHFNDLKVKKKDLKTERENLLSENESLKQSKVKLENDVSETRKEKDDTDNKITNYDDILKQLNQLSADLLLGSEIRAEVTEALVKFDRRELLDICKLVAPPTLMQQALEQIMLFADLFFDKTEESYQKAAAAAAASSSSSALTTTSPTNDKKGSSKGNRGDHGDLKRQFEKERTWADIKKFMSNDNRPALTDLSPTIISHDKYSVKKLLDQFNSLDQNQVTKTSTSTGVVFDFCKAMLECAHCIQQRNDNEMKIERFKLYVLNQELSSIELKLKNLEAQHDEVEASLLDNEKKLRANTKNDEDTVTDSEDTKTRIEDMRKQIEEIMAKKEKPLNDLVKVTEKVIEKLDKNQKDKNQSLLNIKNLNNKLDPILDQYDELSANIIYLDKRENDFLSATELPPK
jgi:predicted  nucleic acid-binding Zn-ribbon protein